MYYVVANGKFYKNKGIKWTNDKSKADVFTLDDAHGIANNLSDRYNASIIPV